MIDVCKENILKFELLEYVFYGGYSHLPYKKLPTIDQLEKISDEKWNAHNATIYTLENNRWSIDFTYLSDGAYFYDAITVFPLNKSFQQFIRELNLKYPNIKYESFYNDESVVLITYNGTRIFFLRRYDNNYLLSKLYCGSCMTNTDKQLIVDTMTKMDFSVF